MYGFQQQQQKITRHIKIKKKTQPEEKKANIRNKFLYDVVLR